MAFLEDSIIYAVTSVAGFIVCIIFICTLCGLICYCCGLGAQLCYLNLDLNKHTKQIVVSDKEINKNIWNFIAKIVHETWRYNDHLGRDARNLPHNYLQIKKIYLIENIRLWEKYQANLNTRPARCDNMEELSGLLNSLLTYKHTQMLTRPPAKGNNSSNKNDYGSCKTHTQEHLEIMMEPLSLNSAQANAAECLSNRNCAFLGETEIGKCLSKDEILLFHGTKGENLTSIINNGFKISYASSRSLYGKAIYLSDSSQKADQYTDVACERKLEGLSMILCRVAIGNVGNYEEHYNNRGQYDTVIAGEGKRFTEVLKFDPEQCYPAFVIVCDRIIRDEVDV